MLTDDAPEINDKAPDVLRSANTAGLSILIVEDQPDLRLLLRRFLERSGFQVLEGSNGVEGLEKFEQAAAEITAVVSDVMMPVMSGLEMCRKLREKQPALKIVFISAYSESLAGGSEELPPGAILLRKPFLPGALLEHLRP